MAATRLTNSTARKEAARKAGKCQVCGAKTKGRSVHIDYDKQKVVKSALGKAKPGRAFYCDEHADKKETRLNWRLSQRNGTSKPKRKASAKKAKATPKRKRTTGSKKASKATPRKRTAKKSTAKATPKRKRTAKAKASSSAAEPF